MQRSERLLKEAKLPSRLEAHEQEEQERSLRHKHNPRERELQAAQKRMRERKIGVKRYTYKPKITQKVPDYHAKQRAFEETLKQRKAELKAQVESTAPRPFKASMHDEPAEKADKILHDIMHDQQFLPETRWPYCSSRLSRAADGAQSAPPTDSRTGPVWRPTKSFTARQIEVKKSRLEVCKRASKL